jgi:hypothetical protein
LLKYKLLAEYLNQWFCKFTSLSISWMVSGSNLKNDNLPRTLVLSCPFTSWKALAGKRRLGWRHIVWRRDSSKTFYATIHSEKKMTYFMRVLFGKWLCQFWRICKDGVRVSVTTATDSWGLTAVAVCRKH